METLQTSTFDVPSLTIRAQADDEEPTAEADASGESEANPAELRSALPTETVGTTPTKAEWERMEPEARAEMLEPLLERAMRRAAEVAVQAKITFIMPEKKHPQGGGEEGREMQIPRYARDDKSIRDDKAIGDDNSIRILPTENESPRGGAEDGRNAEPGCGYVLSDGSECGAQAGEDGYCGRHSDWVELVEDKWGIECPEDRDSLRRCLQQVMALVLAKKISWREAEIVTEICRLLNRNLRWKRNY
jgi:hypothetical protein